jgi:ribonuclease J
MNLTIHRGTNQIGGTSLEFATDTTRILLDLGLPLDYSCKSIEEQKSIVEQAKDWTVGVDAIFISHYHQDHHGLLSKVQPGVPVFVTAGTEKMFKMNAVFMKPYVSSIENLLIVEPERIQSPAIPVQIGDIIVTAFTVDHSAYDACAFLIQSGSKSILYSGDLRLHGVKGSLYRKLPRNVDYLVLEGTNIEKCKVVQTEKRTKEELIELFNENLYSLNFIWCSGQNIDRLVNIFSASRATRKTMVVDVYVAAVLQEIHQLNDKIPSVESHGIKVLYTHGSNDDDQAEYYLRFNKNRILPSEIKQNPDRFVVVIRPSMLPFLKAQLTVPTANIVTSLWKKYEETEMDFFNWVDQQGYNRKHIHTSGHADRESLAMIAEFINPKKIIPMHTENKEEFFDLFGEKTLILDDNELLKIFII